MAKLTIFSELWEFCRVHHKWWLAPIVLFIVFCGMVLVFAQTSALAPFLYSLI